MTDRPQALVFDFDGTIIDTETALFEAWVRAFERAGVAPIPLGEWQQSIGRSEVHRVDPHAHLATSSLPAAEVERIDAVRRDERDAALAAAPVEPGIEMLLGWAESAGVAVAIASSSPTSWVHPRLEGCGLSDRFEVISCAGDGVPGKPDPATYRIACERLDVDPARSWAIEDSPTGVAAAVAAGLSVIACPGPITRGLGFSAAAVEVASLTAIDPASFHWAR